MLSMAPKQTSSQEVELQRLSPEELEQMAEDLIKYLSEHMNPEFL